MIPTDSFAVRPAVAADLDAIMRLVNAAYQAEAFCVSGDRLDRADTQAKFDSGMFYVIDGATPGTLAGSVFCSIAGRRGYLGLLAVDPGMQGRGLSRLLVGHVEAHCRAAGCNFLDLTVVHVREDLFPFYLKLGFFPSDTLVFPRPARMRMPFHLVQMTKALHAPARLSPPR